MGGLAWEGNGRELTGRTGEAASPARGPAAELELGAHDLASTGLSLKEPESHRSLRKPQPSQEEENHSLGHGHGLRRHTPEPERGLAALRHAVP